MGMSHTPSELQKMLNLMDAFLLLEIYQIVNGQQLLHSLLMRSELEKLVCRVPQINLDSQPMQVLQRIFKRNIAYVISKVAEITPWHHINKMNVRKIQFRQTFSVVLANLSEATIPAQFTVIYQYVLHTAVVPLAFLAYFIIIPTNKMLPDFTIINANERKSCTESM